MKDYIEIQKHICDRERIAINDRNLTQQEKSKEFGMALGRFPRFPVPRTELYDCFPQWCSFGIVGKRLQDVVAIYYIFYKKYLMKIPISEITYAHFIKVMNEIDECNILYPIKSLMKDIKHDYSKIKWASNNNDAVLFKKQMSLLRQHSIILKHAIIKLLDVQDWAYDIRTIKIR